MAFRDEHGVYQFKRTKNKKADQLISWCVDSVFGKAKSPLAYAPYSQNSQQKSRWGALDFDAHDGNFARARTLLRRAFHFLRARPDMFLIVEHSGKGFHLWCLTYDLQTVSWWIRLLKAAAKEADARIVAGVCELFPNGTRDTPFGKAMRAPGTYHPELDNYSKIEFQNCDRLLEFWAQEQRAGKHLVGGEREEFLSYSQESEPELIKVYPLNTQWLERFRIREVSTRNEMLKNFTSFMFPQVSRARAERHIYGQFAGKSVSTKATLEEHLSKFGKCWEGMLNTWMAKLSPAQFQKYSSLSTDNAKEAFRIILGFSRLAAEKGSTEFIIARANLAERLEVTRPGASYLVNQFITSGILTRTKSHIRRKKPAMYIWNI